MIRIRETREHHQISQAALSTELGWGQSRLSNYETGIRTPDLDDSRLIVAALNKLGAVCTLDAVFPPESSAA